MEFQEVTKSDIKHPKCYSARSFYISWLQLIWSYCCFFSRYCVTCFSTDETLRSTVSSVACISKNSDLSIFNIFTFMHKDGNSSISTY